MALTRATAAVASGTIREVTAAHGAVPVVTTESRGASRVPHAGRRSRSHVHHGRIQESGLEGSVVAFMESVSRLNFRLRKSQALKVIVLVHRLVLRKAGGTRKVPSVKLGPFKSMRLWVSGGAMLQTAVVGV